MSETTTYDEARSILARLTEQRKRDDPNLPGPIASRLITFDLNAPFKVAVGLDYNQCGTIDVVAIARSSLPPEGERTALVSRSMGGHVMHLSTRYEEFIHMENIFMSHRENSDDVMDLIGDRVNLTMEKLRADHPDNAAIAKALTFKRVARTEPAAG